MTSTRPSPRWPISSRRARRSSRSTPRTPAASPRWRRGSSAGTTAVLVGSSGAGKSTLTNTLLGIDRMKTAAVRESDARGRHTTTHRALIPLPSGACLIDTPGMRELKPTGEEVVAENFSDIDALAGECRFRDCQHQREPGCAVRAAIDDGRLDAARYAHYLKLSDEVAGAATKLATRLAQKADEKRAGQGVEQAAGRQIWAADSTTESHQHRTRLTSPDMRGLTEHAPDILHHAALDARMVRAVRGIKLLGMVSWPIEVQHEFLARWARGDASLPVVEYPKYDFSETRRELAAIVDEADPSHPLGHYVVESALSWSLAAELLEAIGTPEGHRILDPAVRTSRCAAAGQRADHVRGGAALHRHRQRARSRTAGAVGAGVDLRDRAATAAAIRPRRFLQRAGDRRRARSAPDRQGRRRRHAHPPALRRRLQRLRPPPAARARGVRAFADRVERSRTTGAAEPGAVVAAHHRDPGRAGDLRRTDHRQHRHRAHEAREPAHRGGRARARRRQLHRRVPLFPRRRPARRRRASRRRSACSAACR